MGFFSIIGSAISGTFSFVKQIFTSDDRSSNYSTNYVRRPTYPNYYDRSSSYYNGSTRQPSYNRQPSYDRQPSYNQQPSYDRQPSYNRQPSYPTVFDTRTPHSFNFGNTQTTLPTRVVKPVQKTITFLQMTQLDEYPLPKEILAIECDTIPQSTVDRLIQKWTSNKELYRTEQSLYIDAYKKMAFFEEAVDTIKTREYNFNQLTLNRISGKQFYFRVGLTSEEFFAAIDDNRLFKFTLKPRSGDGAQLNGKITKRESGKIFVDIYPARNWRSTETYDIIFEINRTVYQLQHNALAFIKTHRLFEILINNPMFEDQYLPSSTYDMASSNETDLNSEQRLAVKCMISGQYNPVPYLLYGPPGTGKTKTVVAAIEKIVRTTTKNILVCAQSNAACNEIAERLTKVLTKKQMLRMFSASYDLDKISDTIRPFCNLFDGELKYPSLEYLYEFRVLICTFSTSGCLVRARHYPNYDPRHFGYVFIDECASAHETMALIPIAGLCTSVGNVHTNIVLIGDPKQLDAVTKSEYSTVLGFKTSWFEHLFNQPLYQRYSNGRFNQTFITQLVQNYRSHPEILRIPNELFYENALQAVTSPEHIALDVEGLLRSKKQFPIIFKSVQGFCKRPEDDTSSFNAVEVDAVMEFIELLLSKKDNKISESDIGVVSPYKLQCKIIRQRCEKNKYNEIQIGTAEVFQGQERKVMIISTVQSGKKNLSSFLKNPQRFNVMITRARSLLIIVGDPFLLRQDENWLTFIQFCFKNRCLIQGKRYFGKKNVTNL